MSVVHGRGHGTTIDTFGVSGYVYQNVFVIYDRRTNSLWYPDETDRWIALSGPRQGEVIPIDAHPAVTTLGTWREAHPQTVVLLGSRTEQASIGSVTDDQ